MLHRQDQIEARTVRVEVVLGITPVPAAPVPSVARPVPVPVPVSAFGPPGAILPGPSAASPSKPPPPQYQWQPDTTLPQPHPQPPPREARAASNEPTLGLESRVGLHWLNRIGVITLTLGVAFAFKTAVDNDWLSPTARIVSGLALALGVLVVGDVLRRRGQAVFAQGLTGLGLSLFYLSFWASFGLYHLLPQPVVFAAMVGTTIASAALAVHYRARAIAILAMVGGYITPVVLATAEPHPLIFVCYLLVLNLGGIALSRKRGWPVLEYLAAVATCTLYAGWCLTSATPDDRVLATAFALAVYVQLSIAPSRIPWQCAQVLASVATFIWWHESQAVHLPILVLAVAGLAVAELRRFREAPLWAAIWLWILEIVHVVIRGASPTPTLDLGCFVLSFAMFYVWMVMTHVRGRRAFHGIELALMLVNPAAFVATSLLVVEPAHHGYAGALVVAVAAAHLVLARLVWNPGGSAVRDPHPGTLALGIAIALITLAVPLQLTGSHVAIAWTVEGTALAWLASRRTASSTPTKLTLSACAVLVLALVRLLAADVQLDQPVLQLAPFANPRFVACAVMAMGLFVSARAFRGPFEAIITYVIGHVIVLLALGLEIAGWVERSDSDAHRFGSLTVAISILIALYAVLLISLGVIRRRALDRVLGLALMTVVVAKLYLSDVWTVSRAVQVVAFLGLGVLLLLVSYLYSRYRAVIERLWKDPTPDRPSDAA